MSEAAIAQRGAELCRQHCPLINAVERNVTQLRAVADAARELRDATREYVRVSATINHTETAFSIAWHEANQRQLRAEDSLDAALEALAKVEG